MLDEIASICGFFFFFKALPNIGGAILDVSSMHAKESGNPWEQTSYLK